MNAAPVIKIQIRGDLIARLPRLCSQADAATELKRVMDEQDQLTVGHIFQRYLSFPASGPTTPEGLRAISNRLRGNLNAVPARVVNGGVAGGVTNNVFYAKYHELGATIKPHDIVVRNRKALRFLGKGGKVVFAKLVHHPGATLPARAPMQRGIKDRISQYAEAFNAAILRLSKN